MSDEFEIVTIRLRRGDRDALATYFHPVGYNAVIRSIIAKAVDNIRAKGAAAAGEIEVDLDQLEDSNGQPID